MKCGWSGMLTGCSWLSNHGWRFNEFHAIRFSGSFISNPYSKLLKSEENYGTCGVFDVVAKLAIYW